MKLRDIPNDWTTTYLGNLVTHKKGYAFKSEHFQEVGTRIIRVSDTTENSVRLDSSVYINSEYEKDYREYRLYSGDIIVTTVGSRPPLFGSMVGKAIKIPVEVEGSLLNQNMVKLKPKKNLVDGNFLYALLKTHDFLGHIVSIVTGNANQVSISLKDLFSYKIPLPPLDEQRRIAEILGTWDDAITLIERLIEARQRRKKALMQQLLTGKTRFAEFVGSEWRDVSLGEVAKVIMGQSPASEFYNEDGKGLPLIQGNADITDRRTTPRTYTSQITKKCQVGDIIMA